MRRNVFVLVAIAGVFATACTVGRDLTYVPADSQSNLDESPPPDGGASPSTDPDPNPAPGPGPTSPDGGGTTAGDGGAVRPANCPAEDSVESEPNDTPAQANALTPGDTCGTLSSTKDIDAFTFVVKHVDIGVQFQADGDAMMTYIDKDDDTDTGDSAFNGGGFTLYGATVGHHYAVTVSSTKGHLQGYLLTLTN